MMIIIIAMMLIDDVYSDAGSDALDDVDDHISMCL